MTSDVAIAMAEGYTSVGRLRVLKGFPSSQAMLGVGVTGTVSPMGSQHNRFRFDWREGNRFELLIDGGVFYPAMLHAIAGARRYVLLEMYLAESGAVADRFVAALGDAAKRGVEVKLLFDGFGALGFSAADRARLTDAGVDLRLYNPLRPLKGVHNLARDHRKVLVVDDMAFVGGAGITDAFDPPDRPHMRWRETMVAIRGPIVMDWRALFAEVWRRAGGALTRPAVVPAPLPDGMRGRVDITHAPRRNDITRALLKQIRAARGRVWLATAYFIPSWRIRRDLRAAARRGVDVRLLLPGPHTDHPGVRHAGRRFYSRLLANGVRIFEYQPRFIHSKVAMCDQWVSIGSSNFDRWNVRWNLDANQAVDDPVFAAKVQAMFERDFADAAECRYAQWRERPWSMRLREYGWGRLDTWLDALLRDRQSSNR